jgi:hypothetical protein
MRLEIVEPTRNEKSKPKRNIGILILAIVLFPIVTDVKLSGNKLIFMIDRYCLSIVWREWMKIAVVWIGVQGV